MVYAPSDLYKGHTKKGNYSAIQMSIIQVLFVARDMIFEV